MIKKIIYKIPFIKTIPYLKYIDDVIISNNFTNEYSYKKLNIFKKIPPILINAIRNNQSIEVIRDEIKYKYFSIRENLLMSKIMNYNSRYSIGGLFYEYTILQSIESNKTDLPSYLKNAFLNYINGDFRRPLIEITSKCKKNKIHAALVGPARSTFNICNLVDNHDHIIRLNYSYKNKGIDGTSGYKTTISYLSEEQSDYIIENEIELDNKVKYISKKHSYLDALMINNHSSYYGTLNLGTLAVLDFLNRYNSTISIFRMDLFLTPDRYKDYHPESFERLRTNGEMDKDKIKIEFRKNAIHHHPYLQFILLKTLHKQGYIVLDDKLSNILNASALSYLENLELIY